MLKQRPGSNREEEVDILSGPAADCPPEGTSPDVLMVETDLSADRLLTDAELEAICRLLGEDLARLLDQS